MKKLTIEEFEHSYKLHQKRLNGEEDGVRLDLSGYDLSGMNLSEANLFGAGLYKANLTKANLYKANLTKANLSGANLNGANLFKANLSFANLREADLSKTNLSKTNLSKTNIFKANIFKANLTGANLWEAYLTEAYLREADLSEANLSFVSLTEAYLFEANLTGADLTGADLFGAILYEADLTNAKGIFSNLDWIKYNLEKTKSGYICYKKIGIDTHYADNLPKNWVIEKGSYLTEIVSYDRSDDCSFGINFGTYEWCINNYPESNLWKCLIEFENVNEVVVPYGSSGKARCGRLKLLENLGRVYE